MNIVAKYSREWRDRMGIILLLLVGSAGWFFYDGFVAYPKYNRGVEAYVQILETVQREGFSSEQEIEKEASKRWAQVAQDFDADPQEVPSHLKNVAQQMHFGIGLYAIALVFLFWILREMKRVVRADDEAFDGLTTAFPPFNGTVRVRYDSIFGIARRKWQNKGLALVHFKDARDRSRRVAIDDYKYAGSEAILEKCETVLAEKKARQQLRDGNDGAA